MLNIQKFKFTATTPKIQEPQKISKYLKMKKLGEGSKNNRYNSMESKKVVVSVVSNFQKFQKITTNVNFRGKIVVKIQAYAEKSWLEQEKIPKRKFQDLKNF
jgi:hypothetical protein